MPEGGTLTFTTTVVTFDEATCRSRPDSIEPGAYLEIAVADTGIGMEKEVLEKIFEPFYTTKPIGQGTGLGLAAVRRTVQGHGGHTDVYSEPSRGTVFRLYFPLAPDAVVVPAGAANVVHGSGRILVVDDEPVIRSLAGDMLRLLGYEVTAADGGAEALELYRRGKFDLVILDLVMPRMNGREVLAEIRRIDPEARVLLASGFHLEMDLVDVRREGACGFLSKPFIVASLSRAVAEALQADPVAPLRVLVVDDVRLYREVVTALLRELGHSARVIEDGAAALAAATNETFDLILLDVELSGMSGLEVTAAIRAAEAAGGRRHVPIIAMTGHRSVRDRDRCLAAGMDGFLAKPLMLAKLKREIARVLGGLAPVAGDPDASGRDDLAHRIAAAFLEEVPEWLRELSEAIVRDDAEALRRVAHTLYGSLSHFEAARASELADTLQQAEPPDDRATVAGELEKEVQSLMRTLEARLAKEVQSSP
jgi:CheY-like chemotaxis protein